MPAGKPTLMCKNHDFPAKWSINGGISWDIHIYVTEQEGIHDKDSNFGMDDGWPNHINPI